ncbi:MAG: hypothetical protein ACRDRO_01080 [Pseudonocardiaceae bacterium]
MTRPSAPGAIPPADAGAARVALFGRGACPDDPHTELHRQLRAVSAALPTQARIIGYVVDVGPWNGQRGSIHTTDTRRLDGHPVKGGLIDLLDRACSAHRDVDVIACIDLGRLSRRLVECVRIEGDLAHGVRVLTPDDPAITILSTARSTPRPGTAAPFSADRDRPGPADGRRDAQ